MNSKNLILFLFILIITFSSKAQIVIDNNKVGIGNGMTTPVYSVDMLGTTRIKPSTSSNSYILVTPQSPYGWVFNPNDTCTGRIGSNHRLLFMTAHYIYATNIQYSSDKNLKRNIFTLFDALPIIKKLRPVSFDYNLDYSDVANVNVRNKILTSSKDRLGFIAQEVRKILPQSVTAKLSDSTLCIRMIDFVPLLVKGMQEQSIRIDSLTSEINELKASRNIFKSARLVDVDKNLQPLARLYQNNITPYTEQITINCFIPDGGSDACILIFDMKGKLVKTVNVTGQDKTSVIVPGAVLSPGMYTYSLLINNKEVDSKRMILSN